MRSGGGFPGYFPYYAMLLEGTMLLIVEHDIDLAHQPWHHPDEVGYVQRDGKCLLNQLMTPAMQASHNSLIFPTKIKHAMKKFSPRSKLYTIFPHRFH